jgi:ankyrin repeat protein
MRHESVLLLSALALVAASPDDLGRSPSPVADAVRDGERETVRSLLKDGADVNAAQGDGMTALHWSALANDVSTADMLLVAGANWKATTRLGANTPLILASRSGHAEMVETLLNAGADANQGTSTGTTPLMLAAASGSADAVRMLLARKADVNARESLRGETALMFAAASNRAAVAELLLSNGADPALTTKTVDAPTLTKAADEALKKRLDHLREERTRKAQAAGGAPPPAEKAAEKGSKSGGNVLGKVFGFLSPGKDAKKESNERRERPSYGDLLGVQGGLSALLLASRQGNLETVRVLLDHGADVNQVAEGSRTSPLLIATMNGRFDLAKYLLERGADPNLAAEPSGVTPLYAAINLAWAPNAGYPQPTAQQQQQLTHVDLMKALLDEGADPNVRLKKKVWFSGYNFDRSGLDETGATPFWRAAYGSDVPAMKLLKSYGADPSIPTKAPPARPRVGNQQGREMKDVSGLPPVPVGGPAITPLHAAAGAGFGEGFAANDYRNHPAGFLPAVKYLVEECGADVNARDHEGSTPLHNAAARGDVEMILYLVSKGADVKAVNREGQTTADMANGPVQRTQPFPEALKLLMSLGAKNNNKCVSC